MENQQKAEKCKKWLKMRVCAISQMVFGEIVHTIVIWVIHEDGCKYSTEYSHKSNSNVISFMIGIVV